VSVRVQDEQGQAIPAIADVVLTLTTQHAPFSNLAICLHVMYTIGVIACIVWHVIQWRAYHEGHEGPPIDMEHKCLVALVFCLVLLNNPLYPFEYVMANKLFIELLGDLFSLSYTLALFTLWFLFVNQLRAESDRFEMTLLVKIQLGVVCAYGIIAAIFFGWSTGLAQLSPERGLSHDWTGIEVMYVITALIYSLMALSFSGQLILTIAIHNERLIRHKLRFYFFAIPALLCIMAVLTGIFSGTIGRFGQDTPSYVFFLSLYNAYTMFLLWGYWPVHSSDMAAASPQEGTKIFTDTEHGTL